MFRQFPFLHRISSETEGQDHLSGRCVLLISVLSQFMEWKIIERDFNKWENEIEMSSSRWPQLPLITLEVLSRQEENPKPSSRTSSTERSARTRTRRCAESTRTASPCGSWSKAVDRWPNRRKASSPTAVAEPLCTARKADKPSEAKRSQRQCNLM